jgi:hypothetical protein
VRREGACLRNPVVDEEEPLGTEGDDQRDGSGVPNLAGLLRSFGGRRSERPHVGARSPRVGVRDLGHDGVPLTLIGSARRVRRHELDPLVGNEPP